MRISDWSSDVCSSDLFDVGFEDDGATTRAAAVLLDADSGQVLASEVARIPTRVPYIPGLLSYRELPALLLALEELPQAPDLAFVDGHGIAHPRGPGIASHFGVATGLPRIGVATKILVGSGSEPHQMRRASKPLRHKPAPLTWTPRTHDHSNPLVGPTRHRLPEATNKNNDAP